MGAACESLTGTIVCKHIWVVYKVSHLLAALLQIIAACRNDYNLMTVQVTSIESLRPCLPSSFVCVTHMLSK